MVPLQKPWATAIISPRSDRIKKKKTTHTHTHTLTPTQTPTQHQSSH